MSHRCSRHFWDRREFLFTSGGGISGLALAYLLDRDRAAVGRLGTEQRRPARRRRSGVNPYAPKPPHFKPRATAVISLFMGGGWSQMDTFDPKPALTKYAGQPIDDKVKGDVIVRQGSPGPADAEPVQLQEARPERDRGLGDLPVPQPARGRLRVPAFGLRPLERPRAGHLRDADGPDQPRASRASARGSPTAWARSSSSLPAFVVMTDARGGPLGGPNDWSAGLHAGRLPGHAVPIDRRSDRRSQAAGRASRRRISALRLDALAKLNELDMQKYPGNSELAARISSYELAYRMQGCAPSAVDVGERIGGDKEALRAGRQGHRAVRAPVPDGAPAGGARRPVRADVLGWRRQPERGHLGRARRRQVEPYRSTRPRPTGRLPGSSWT